MEQPHPKRLRTDGSESLGAGSQTKEDGRKEANIPTFDLQTTDADNGTTTDANKILEAYHVYQAVHFKGWNNRSVKKKEEQLSWKDIGSIYQSLNAQDKESWCIENQQLQDNNTEDLLKPRTFLAPRIVPSFSAYCSFLVQKDKDSYQALLERLPVANFASKVPPINDQSWSYEPCVWIFFGRNPINTTSNNNTPTGEPLEGRGLHTDSVSHDGTWHFQLSGQKDWFLSPSCDLVRHWQEEQQQSTKIPPSWDESTKLHVPCQEGDILMVNTRLWFHRTVIPSQQNPSVSYARDFRMTTKDATASSEEEGCGAMSNLDGLYARSEIEAGTIIFSEKDMPDCELHRSKDNPNCEVVELEDGTSAVVSRRTIVCGEFFCVAESSDEEEDVEGEFEEEEFEEDE
ncbi:UTP6, small subunit (SSU) processome component, homolog (yeast) [Seminavis robusta]|uniref:UTP6, small subunit (SSU) processome component, homolog (Yeast) n=1 Tax=Seminavis robusta TaxID=568900 RepID=A0A9N8GZA6_9STRA|nr:UTP6, small subunit (SSU) processome component, homolog (yeast) [Seminavis robusta]|eukprot:Sro1_g000810.1 UTP6, small subunit (SSU) processome component, homolog (yeast) (401) ;mRNA; f:219305-220507